ncbi:unnamed protein product [Onchocerca ochengi]|uniref:NUC domain-containing protein n=1 Tax=Onchocerca ochengi TaxID=42157 RepID=A0A182ELR3_ONCOC|nr:unnamed protein product [Onchocerca ochengi]
MCYLPDCSNDLQSALIKRSDSNFTVALIERINPTSAISRSLPGDKSSEWIATSLSVKGHFIDLEEVTSEYADLNDEIVVISGPIYDFDDKASRLHSQRNSTPSHIFRVIFRCKDSKWLKDEFRCENTNSLDVLSFILPNVPGDYNCLDPLSYLSTNRARLRDIELLTGLEFLPTSRLPEEQLYSDEFSVTLRTLLPEDLWVIAS